MFLNKFNNKIILIGIIAISFLILLVKFFKGTKNQGKWITMFQYAGVDPPNPLVVSRPLVSKQFVKDGYLQENVQSQRGLGE